MKSKKNNRKGYHCPPMPHKKMYKLYPHGFTGTFRWIEFSLKREWNPFEIQYLTAICRKSILPYLPKHHFIRITAGIHYTEGEELEHFNCKIIDSYADVRSMQDSFHVYLKDDEIAVMTHQKTCPRPPSPIHPPNGS